MKFERRDILKLGAGSAAGLVVSPVPWKLLDDSAIWTQGHAWAAPLPHGALTTTATACPLCPAGCSATARRVSGVPISLSGALCAAGLAAHQLPYHPERVKTAADLPRLFEQVRARKGTLAILDLRPGRVMSDLYRRLVAALPGAVYVTPPAAENATLAALRGMVAPAPVAFALDLARTRTVLSFGAPVLDGWGTPEPRLFRLIQIDPRASRTASVASDWVPIRPGTEVAFALGIAAVMIAENLYDREAAARVQDFEAVRALVANYAPRAASEISGVAPARIVEVARSFSNEKPAIAIGGGDPGGGPLGHEEERAIAILNLLNGSVGRPGGILARGGTPVETGTLLSEIAGQTVSVLLLDGSPQSNTLPWEAVGRKLTRDALVISLSPYSTGLARHAQWHIPSPAPFETWTEVGASPESDADRWGLAPALLPPIQGTIAPDGFLSKLAAALGVAETGTLEAALQARAGSIHRARRGTIVPLGGSEPKAVTEFKSGEDLWKLLASGAVWTNAPAPAPAFTSARLLGKDPESLLRAARGRVHRTDDRPLTLVAYGWRHEAAEGPVMSKLYEESGLRSGSSRVEVHPTTGSENGLEDGSSVIVETARGTHAARIQFNRAVRPGVIEAATRGNPSITDVCEVRDDGQWRLTGARLRRA